MNEETNSALQFDDGHEDGRKADKKETELICEKDTAKINIENSEQSFLGKSKTDDSLVPSIDFCDPDYKVDNLFNEKQSSNSMQHDTASTNNVEILPDKEPNLFEVPLDTKDFDVEIKHESTEDHKNKLLMVSSHPNKKDKRKEIEKRFSCEHCEKRFAYNRQLVKHNRIHTGGKPYKCSDCNFVFKRNDHLIRHQKTHSAEKPFKCENCDGAFKRKDHLLRHNRTHSAGEKITINDEQRINFQTKADVIGDNKIHTRSYKCEKNFTKIESITASIKTNKDFCPQIKENMCLICSKTFTRKSHIARHMKIHSGSKEKLSTNGEAMNEEAMNEEATNEEATNEEATNEEAMNEEAMNEEAMNEEAMNKEATNEEAMNEEAMNEEAVNEKAKNGEAKNEEALKSESCETVFPGPQYKMNEERNSVWEFTKDGGQMLAKLRVDLVRPDDQNVFGMVDSFKKESDNDCETGITIKVQNNDEQSLCSLQQSKINCLIPSIDFYNPACDTQKRLGDSAGGNFSDKLNSNETQHNIAMSVNDDALPDEKPNLFEISLSSLKGIRTEMEIELVGNNEKELHNKPAHPIKKIQSINKKKQIKMDKREKRYSCEHCEKRFASNHHLIKHNRIHTGEKPYKCSDCDFVFGRNDHLIRHKKTHSTEKPFKCDNCDGSFKRKDHLLRHSRTHSAEKKIACDVCNKLFKSKEDVNGHMKTHTRPYKCEKCEKSFAKKENIRAHMKTHEEFCSSQIKENMCLICSRTFTRKSHVARHMKIHGGNKEQLCANEGVVNKDNGDITSVTVSQAIEDHFNNEKLLSNDTVITIDVTNSSLN
ncbi:zinc finger protein 3 homolog isoform X1 [Hydra vulgaris]|uniref:zinc finger protein 3 homolog isoform X1 n=1 Tax=Hydra vulgaris TaxID=6087 RepID=UPI0032E9C265